MRKPLFLLSIFIIVLLIRMLGINLIDPAPVYSQDIQNQMPDLSSINIYFSEANGELSQFDRSDRFYDFEKQYSRESQHVEMLDIVQ